MNENPALPMIRAFEQFRSSPYWDVNHHRVGYGSDTITRPDGTVQEVKPGMNVTQDDAERDLQRRVAASQEQIKSQIGEGPWNKLGPNGQAALTSVHYNYGHLPWGVQNAATSGEPAKVASSINGLSGDNGGVNADRRQAEANAALGIGGGAGRFGLNGVSSVAPELNRPNVSGSETTTANGTSDLLSQLMKARNPVPAYAPADGKSFANSPLEGMIRGAAGQGTYTPPIVAKLNGLGGSLSSLFGGSNQASQGSAPAPGNAASVSASPADAAPPPPPPASDSQASAGGGTNSGGVPMPPPRPDDLGLGTPIANASSSGGSSSGGGLLDGSTSILDSLKGLFGNSGGNAG